MDSSLIEPSWTKENQNREKGSTTFKRCGWCSYAGTGTYRYGCMISGSCDLLKSYNRNLTFDTSCIIKQLGKRDINDIIESKYNEIKVHKESIKREKEQISILKKIKVSKELPPLPDNRKFDHFNIGDGIMFYDHSLNLWKEGAVCEGYRYHDGIVPFNTKEQKGFGCGTGVPTILLKKEFIYLFTHKEKALTWFKLACDEKQFNGKMISSSTLYEALTKSESIVSELELDSI